MNRFSTHNRPFTGALCVLLTAASCGVYTFSGSTLPSHLKTVDIPLFLNRTLQPGIDEELTGEVNDKVLAGNLLRIVREHGDATITGTITGYDHEPRSYGTGSDRTVDVSEYAVRISVDVEFLDNKKGKPLYQGRISGEGVYDFNTGTEETGRRKAVRDIVEQILQNSVQSW